MEIGSKISGLGRTSMAIGKAVPLIVGGLVGIFRPGKAGWCSPADCAQRGDWDGVFWNLGENYGMGGTPFTEAVGSRGLLVGALVSGIFSFLLD